MFKYEDKKMSCPFCKSILQRGEQRKYETLIDHVSDPNMEDYPLRDTWVCSCKKSDDLFWDFFGDAYMTKINPELFSKDINAIEED